MNDIFIPQKTLEKNKTNLDLAVSGFVLFPLGGDKGIREERSDGIASLTFEVAEGINQKLLDNGRCERQPAGVLAAGARLAKAKRGIPEKQKMSDKSDILSSGDRQNNNR